MKKTLLLPAVLLTAGLIYFTGCQSGHDHSEHSHGKAASGPPCPVSGEALGSMGDPYKFTYQGKEIQLCCESCHKDFMKDPQKYLAKMAK